MNKIRWAYWKNVAGFLGTPKGTIKYKWHYLLAWLCWFYENKVRM